MEKIEKWLPVVILVGVALLGFWAGNRNTPKYQAEIAKYRENQNSLLTGLKEYQTSDSLRAVEIGVLTLRLNEYKHFREEDAKTIATLKTKNRQLQSVVSAQSEMLANIESPVVDTVIVYLDGFGGLSGKDSIQRIDYHDDWLDFNAIIKNKKMTADIAMRDSLIIVESVKYKRFLGFLWYTKKVKDRKIDAVSKNPYNHIQSLEKILVEP